jgi:CHAD domain-containing protein
MLEAAAARSSMGTWAASRDAMSPDEPILPALAKSVDKDLKKVRKRMRKAKRGDPDGVHDARTALRRVREDLVVMGKTAFDPGRATRLEGELRAQEKALAKPRDSDVMLAIIHDYLERHPSDRGGLGTLVARLESRRKKALKKARRRLGGSRRTLRAVRKLIHAKGGAVTIRTPKDPTKATPVLVHHFTHGVTWQQYDAVLAYDVLSEDDPDVLHRFRSACRRLRYGMELLGESVPHGDAIVGELRAVQSGVGEMHDHHVCAELVTRWVEGGKLPASVELARFLAEQKRTRDRLREAVKTRVRGVLGPQFRQRLERALDERPRPS